MEKVEKLAYEDRDNVFGWINPFERRASDEERDKHLKRLLGVQEMDRILRQMEDRATLYYHKRLGLHPCGMLPLNDKQRMRSWDEKNLSRYGDERGKELSCIPVLLGSREYDFSMGRCIYCDGWFDNTIVSELCMTVARNPVKGPWVE